MKRGRTQEESYKQMNEGRPAPPCTNDRNHLSKTDRSNQKLEINLGIFAFVSSQTGGLAFWCMLGAYLGQLAIKAFNDRVKKSS